MGTIKVVVSKSIVMFMLLSVGIGAGAAQRLLSVDVLVLQSVGIRAGADQGLEVVGVSVDVGVKAFASGRSASFVGVEVDVVGLEGCDLTGVGVEGCSSGRLW